MKIEEFGSSSFRMLKVSLENNETIVTEPGSMASQEIGLIPSTKFNGGFLKGLILKFFGGESLFVNHYSNTSAQTKHLYITQSTPGDIQELTLNGNEIFLETGSFIARTGNVETKVKWAGFANWIAGEGLFKLSFSGHGKVWYGCYGSVIEKEIVGDFIVDSGHLLSWPPTVKRKLKLSGGLISSFLSKEGFVLQLSGHGKVQLQTRSVKGLAQWLNARFW